MIDCIKSEQYISKHREETQEVLCNFTQTDLLLFWSDNPNVYAGQQKLWQPFIDSLQAESKQKLSISESLQIPNNEPYLLWLKNSLQKFSDKEMTAVFLVASLTKSVILGLSILKEKTSVENIYTAAFWEEIYQNKLWGTDEEALQRREQIKTELQKIWEYLYK